MDWILTAEEAREKTKYALDEQRETKLKQHEKNIMTGVKEAASLGKVQFEYWVPPDPTLEKSLTAWIRNLGYSSETWCRNGEIYLEIEW